MAPLDDLHTLKDDMTAFIEGHGMRRFHGFVSDEVESVMWDSENPESWKDFVELAKASNAPFLIMSDVTLDREDVEILVDRLRGTQHVEEDDVEEARWMRSHVGHTGYIQLGFAHQGVMFL